MFGTRWRRVIDTADPDLLEPTGPVESGQILRVSDRSIVVLQLAPLQSDGQTPAPDVSERALTSGIALADS
jgi:hypothetical protein